MAITKIKPIRSTLKKALDYIENSDKTEDKLLVSSFGCSYETADIEFGFTISQALCKGSNVAHHLIQSFSPEECAAGLVTPQKAMRSENNWQIRLRMVNMNMFWQLT